MDVSRTDLVVLRVLEAEENENNGDSDTGVESGRQDVVVLGPPGEVTATDNIVENESDDGPGDVVDGSGRRNVASSIEDDREAEKRISIDVTMA